MIGLSIRAATRIVEIAVVVCLTSSLAPSKAHASTSLAGTPHFFVTLELVHPPSVGQPGTIRAAAGCSGLPTGSGLVRVHVPRGLRVLGGDVSRSVHFGGAEASDNVQWEIQVLPERTGPFAIVADLRLERDGGRTRDEAEWLLLLNCGRDSTAVAASRELRVEHVSGSQRYRYAGPFLVPIRQAQRVTQSDVVERAKAVRQQVAQCRKCGIKEPAQVDFVVFVDEAGEIVRYDRLTMEGADTARSFDSSILTAAERALPKWRFAPGRTRSQNVADFVLVSVKVVPENAEFGRTERTGALDGHCDAKGHQTSSSR